MFVLCPLHGSHPSDSLAASGWCPASGEAVTPGTLPAGTETDAGVIVRSTLTAYEVEGGEFVPFHRVHGRPAPASPLVVLR